MTTVASAPGAGRSAIAGRERALAGLAFATRPAPPRSGLSISRHLAFLPPDELALDLSNPAERDFGDYELLELLGQGGMGVVYRARQKSLTRDVAVKLLAAGPWASAEFIARFEREAQHAAQLNHPNIVPIFEIGEHEGLHFFSMALVRGKTLAGRIADEGPLAAKDAARVVRTIAEALSYAHALGVLHLDLKPGNVLIDERGAPLVADFGLARRLDQALGVDSDEVSGTPSYMAPEQAQLKTHPLSAATDVWGLGAILFECLAGVPPFLGATPRDTLLQVVHDDVAPIPVGANVPADLGAIALKCLAKEPRLRYASARELADDLGRFVEGRTVTARTPTSGERAIAWVRRNPMLAAFAGLFVVALVAGLAATTVQWRRAERNASEVRETLWRSRLDLGWRDVLDDKTTDALPALVANLEEQQRAGDARAAAATRLRLGTLAANAPRLIDVATLGEHLTVAALSPDGAILAAGGGNGGVHGVEVATGRVLWRAATHEASRFWAEAEVRYLRATPDGRWFVSARRTPDVVVAPGGFDEVLIDAATGAVHVPPRDAGPGITDMTVSADGEYAVLRGAHPDGARWMRTHRTRDWAPLAPAVVADRDVPVVLVSARGALVAKATDSMRRIELCDGATLAPRAVLALRHGHARAWAFSRDATWLAVGTDDGELHVVDTRDGTMRILDATIASGINALAFSEDAAWLGAAYHGGQAVVYDLATRARVFAPVETGRVPRQLELDRAGGTLFAQGVDRARLWRFLPGGEAVLAAERPSHPLSYQNRATVVDAANGLMAAVVWNGEVRFWRLPAGPAIVGAAPRLEPVGYFDGVHVAAVRGAGVEVVDLAGEPVGPAVALPAEPSFVTLLGDGRTLATTVGSELRFHDYRSGAPIGATIALPASATRLLPAGGNAVLVGHLARRNEVPSEALQRYLGDGTRVAETALTGVQRIVRVAPDGGAVVAVRYGVAELLDGATLASRGRVAYGHDVGKARAAIVASATDESRFDEFRAEWDGTPILDADFSADSRDLWISTGAPYEVARLVRIDARDARVLETRELRSDAVRVVALADGAVALRTSATTPPVISLPGGGARALAGQTDLYSSAFAATPDRAMLALGHRNGFTLLDAASGEWLAPPLGAGLESGEHAAQLEISRDGGTVVAWTNRGRYLAWSLSADRRPLAEIQTLLRVLHPDPRIERSRLATPLTEDLRASLRRQDSGPPRPSATPRPPLAAVPSPDDPRFVPLEAACGRAPAAGRLLSSALIGAMPFGRQRLAGVEFDVRCVVGLDAGSSTKRVEDIAVPLPRFVAIELLLTGAGMLQGLKPEPYAFVELAYADGGIARMPLVYRRDVAELWYDAGDVTTPRLAYAAVGAARLESGRGEVPWIYAARVDNPHPGRDVRALALEAADRAWAAPVVYAITLDPGASR